MKIKTFLLLVLVTGILASGKAQGSFGLFAEGGVNKLHKRKFPDSFYAAQMEEYSVRTGFRFASRVGIYFNARLSNKLLLGLKFLYTTGGYKANYHEILYSSPATGSTGYELIYVSQQRAVGFNPYLGYKHKKFLFNLGAQALDIFWQYDHENFYGIKNGVSTFSSSQDILYILEKGFSMDYGITAGVTFQLNPEVALESSFYYGFYRWEYRMNEFALKATQLTIGIKCALWVSKKNEAETTGQ